MILEAAREVMIRVCVYVIVFTERICVYCYLEVMN